MALIERSVGPTPIREPRPDRNAPPPDQGLAAAVTRALAHLGVVSARPLLGAFGSGTYELACDEDRLLVARVADDSSDAARDRVLSEQHTLHALAGVDFPAPRALGMVSSREGPLGRAILVTTRPEGEPLLARLARRPVEVVSQMGELAHLHARLHGPAGAAHLRASSPTEPLSLSASGLSELLGDVAVLGAPFAEPTDWLVRNRPGTGPEALCHGASPPAHVLVSDERDDDDPGLTLTDWCAGGLAEPEFDVALALLTFWLSPAMAANRSERRSLRLVREWLRSTYCERYLEIRPLDADRLRYWEAFHAVRLAAAMTLRGEARPGSGFGAQYRRSTPALGHALFRRFASLAGEG